MTLLIRARRGYLPKGVRVLFLCFFFPVFLFVGRSVARSFSARMANARLLVTRVYFRECAFLGRLAARLRDLEGRAQKGVMELGVGRQRKARSRKYAFPKWLGEEQP